MASPEHYPIEQNKIDYGPVKHIEAWVTINFNNKNLNNGALQHPETPIHIYGKLLDGSKMPIVSASVWNIFLKMNEFGKEPGAREPPQYDADKQTHFLKAFGDIVSDLAAAAHNQQHLAEQVVKVHKHWKQGDDPTYNFQGCTEANEFDVLFGALNKYNAEVLKLLVAALVEICKEPGWLVEEKDPAAEPSSTVSGYMAPEA